MSKFPEFDHSRKPAEPVAAPLPIKDWLIFGLAFSTVALAGLCVIQWGQITKRFEPKIVEKEVEVVVEKEIPVEVVKEVERVVEVKSSESTLTDVGFNAGPLKVTKEQVLACFRTDGDFKKLVFVQSGKGWRDEDAEITLHIHQSDAGEVNGIQFLTHIDSIQDVAIQGTRDNTRIVRLALGMAQVLRLIDKDVTALMPNWLMATLLQPNSFAQCDLLDNRISTRTELVNKSGGMIVSGGIGRDPDHNSGRRP